MTRESRGGRSLERRPAGASDVRVAEDPISIGLDKSINIDLGRLHAPVNHYDADCAWFDHRPDEMKVSFVFGKRNRDNEGPSFRTRLEIRYPPENFVNHFWQNSRRFHEQMGVYAQLWPRPRNWRDDGVVVPEWTSAKDHSEWANLEAMSHAGSEATIDFYSFSTHGVARFQSGGPSASLRVDPVVRVQLSTFELLRLLDEAAPIVQFIEERMPTEEALKKLKEARRVQS